MGGDTNTHGHASTTSSASSHMSDGISLIASDSDVRFTMSWDVAPAASDLPSSTSLSTSSSAAIASTLPQRPPALTTQQSSSLPSTPYQRPRTLPFQSRSPSPRRGSSPHSTHSEFNPILPPLRTKPQYGGCKYETAMSHFRRRMPYSLGSDLLPQESGPLKESLDADVEKKLTADLTELYNKLLPAEESEQRRARFVRKLEGLLNSKWPGNDVRVRVFGSSGNKLCSSDSDVDICITTPFKELEHVCILADFLAKNGMERVVCVSHAKVPIVKIWDPELQLACDMNVNNTSALENTRMIGIYVGIDVRVRQLAMIIKYWTRRRILNDAALGGTLSSYTWICLIINFLQTRTPPILPSLQQRAQQKNPGATDGSSFDDDLASLAGFGDSNASSLGSLLFQFFRYYSYEIDYETKVVSVRGGKLISKEGKRWHLLQNNRLCVEEPFNTSRNLGNTADDTSFRGLHMELRRAFKAISEGKWDECCEQYEFPPEEERTWERPPPQRRPVIAPMPPLPSRGGGGGGRGGGRGGRQSNHFNRGPNLGRRASSAANRQSNPRPAIPAFTAEVALQAQQFLLQDHFYQQIQILQAQEQELRMQLQNQALLSGRTPPALIRPYIQFPFPQQQQPSSSSSSSQQQQHQQETASNPGSDETPRSRAGTVNHPPLSAPLRQPVFYNPASFLPITIPTIQGIHTNPPSPSMQSAVPELRRSHRRASLANGSPRSNLRAQSQPARPIPSPMLPTFSPAIFNLAIQQQQQQHQADRGISTTSSSRQSHAPSESPPETTPAAAEREGAALPNGISLFSRPLYADENVTPEYIGYYVGSSPQLHAGYRTSTSLPAGPSLPPHTYPAYLHHHPDFRQAGMSVKEQQQQQQQSQANLALEYSHTLTPHTQPHSSSTSTRLTKSRTLPDYGPLIVDGSHPPPGNRQSSSDDSHDLSYLSQSAPSSNDRIYSTPSGTSDTSPQDYPDVGQYDSEANATTALYDVNRRDLSAYAQVNGWDTQSKTPRSAAINGQLGRLETLSERLQRFQMSDQNFNGDYLGKVATTYAIPRHDMGGYSLSTDDEMLGPEQHHQQPPAVSSHRPSQSPNLASVVREASAAKINSSPTPKRRVNGMADSDKLNGVSPHKNPQKGGAGGRHALSTSPNRFQDQKEKYTTTEPTVRRQNGAHHHHHSNGQSGGISASHTHPPASATAAVATPTSQSGWQTTRKKHRKGTKGPVTQSNGGGEPLPADESLRKGG